MTPFLPASSERLEVKRNLLNICGAAIALPFPIPTRGEFGRCNMRNCCLKTSKSRRKKGTNALSLSLSPPYTYIYSSRHTYYNTHLHPAQSRQCLRRHGLFQYRLSMRVPLLLGGRPMIRGRRIIIGPAASSASSSASRAREGEPIGQLGRRDVVGGRDISGHNTAHGGVWAWCVVVCSCWPAGGPLAAFFLLCMPVPLQRRNQ